MVSSPGCLLLLAIPPLLAAFDSPLQRYFARNSLALNDIEPDHDLGPLSIGILLKRDHPPLLQNSTLDRRTYEKTSSELLVARNLATRAWEWPASLEDAAASLKHSLASYLKRGRDLVKRSMRVRITWYDGHDLLHPSCVTNTDWAPTDDSMVGAVTIIWPGKPVCGKFVRISHKNKPEVSVVVRIVDSCAGCIAGTAHIDLTKGAFTKLYAIDVGEVEGLTAKVVKPPVGHKWTKHDVAIYGPQSM